MESVLVMIERKLIRRTVPVFLLRCAVLTTVRAKAIGVTEEWSGMGSGMLGAETRRFHNQKKQNLREAGLELFRPLSYMFVKKRLA